MFWRQSQTQMVQEGVEGQEAYGWMDGGREREGMKSDGVRRGRKKMEEDDWMKCVSDVKLVWRSEAFRCDEC